MHRALRWTPVLSGLLLSACSSSPNTDPAASPSSAGEPVAANAGTAPGAIPALREWTAGSGNYVFTATSRIVVNAAHGADLAETASTFASDLQALSGRAPTIVTGTSADVRAGDFFLDSSSTDAQLGAEGYSLAADSAIHIDAASATGTFYGTRTVLQWLHQSSIVASGSARDWPRYPERGLMVDMGRKSFSVGWVKTHIKELAYLKMNYFHFHLSDDQGFRIESTTHPEVVSQDHFTKQDIRDLLALGRLYHVTIVPEIDMPGHMTNILAAHPDLRLTASDGTVNDGYIDLAKDASYTLMQDLIEEYLPLFTSGYWHLGADEYITNYSAYPQLAAYAQARYGANATAHDVYYGFVNWANGIVRGAGKTMRMWNDGLHAQGSDTIVVDSNIVVDYWSNQGLTPQQLLDAGHTIDNSSYTPTYYVLGVGHPNVTYAYETWTPSLFDGGNTVSADAAGNRGAKVHVWCDHPSAESESQVRGGIGPILSVVAQQAWGSNKPAATYAAFQPIISAVGHAPGTPSEVRKGDLALGRPITASSIETPDFPAENAVDGLLGARWSTGPTDPQWLQIDLGSTQSIGKVFLSWETAYAKSYEVQASNDGSNWTTLYSTTAGKGGVEHLVGLHGSGRYLRLNLTARGTQYGYSLYEVEVYPDSSIDVPAGDLATGRPVSVTSTETSAFPGTYSVDGLFGTRWSSAYSDPQVWQVDLGSVQPIDKLFLGWETAYASSYDVQVSSDGSNWTKVFGNPDGKGGAEVLTGLGASGRYLKLDLRGRGTQYGYSLWEVEAYSN